MDALAEGLGERARLHAARAELLWAPGRRDESLAAAGRAVEMATNPAERELLVRRLRSGQTRRRDSAWSSDHAPAPSTAMVRKPQQ